MPENKVGYYTSKNNDGYIMLSKQFRESGKHFCYQHIFPLLFICMRENSGYLPYGSFMSLQNIFQQLNEYLSTIREDNSAREQITVARRCSTTRLHQ
jgi:hypothetical protein